MMNPGWSSMPTPSGQGGCGSVGRSNASGANVEAPVDVVPVVPVGLVWPEGRRPGTQL
jgi:hypothetical protein